MYPVLMQVGVTFLGLGLFIYTAWRTHKALTEAYSQREHYCETKRTAKIEKLLCFVCLGELSSGMNKKTEEITLSCNHKFHKTCITNVFKNEAPNKRQCPACQKTVTELFLQMSNISV